MCEGGGDVDSRVRSVYLALLAAIRAVEPGTPRTPPPPGPRRQPTALSNCFTDSDCWIYLRIFYPLHILTYKLINNVCQLQCTMLSLHVQKAFLLHGNLAPSVSVSLVLHKRPATYFGLLKPTLLWIYSKHIHVNHFQEYFSIFPY